MDTRRNDLLGEIAADAALERADFLVTATTQLRGFLARQDERVRDLGGFTLIDEDPDYLAIAPDGSFRSRSRYQDEDTGEWVNETEVIESAAELVELYNPADIFAAFAEAARVAAGLSAEPTGASDLLETAHVPPADSFSLEDPYAGAADSWAAGQEPAEPPSDEEEAARRLYDLALAFQDRSQRTEARLFEQFAENAEPLTALIGDIIIVDDEDERLTLGRGGAFHAEVVPEDSSGEWRQLGGAEDLVEFYDPTDVFGDLADALAEAYPALVAGEEGDEAEAGVDAEDAQEDTEDVEDVEDAGAGGHDDSKGTGSADRG